MFDGGDVPPWTGKDSSGCPVSLPPEATVPSKQEKSTGAEKVPVETLSDLGLDIPLKPPAGSGSGFIHCG